MKLHTIQLGQLLVAKRGEGPGAELRISRVPGPMHQVIAMSVYTPNQRLALATLVGLA